MPLSGIQIYKLLPQTNCKECGFPTCLAFAMKLAAKQVELASCPYVSEASKAQLAESAAPPMRLVTLKANGNEVKVGNEVILFRHEKTFYNRPGLFIRVSDSETADSIKAKLSPAEAYKVNYVGIELSVDGFAVESKSGNPGTFATTVQTVRQVSRRPLIFNQPRSESFGGWITGTTGRTSPNLHCRRLQLGSDGRPCQATPGLSGCLRTHSGWLG